MPRLDQRRFLTQISLEIGETRLEVTERSPLHSRSFHLPFEEVPDEPEAVQTSSRRWFWGMVVLWTVTLFTGLLELQGEEVDAGAYLFWGAFAVIASLAFAASRARLRVLRAGESTVVMFEGRPDPAALKAFLSELRQRRDAYLVRQYVSGSAAASNVVDEIQRLAWLRERGAITDEEFDMLKRELLAKPGPDEWRPPTWN